MGIGGNLRLGRVELLLTGGSQTVGQRTSGRVLHDHGRTIFLYHLQHPDDVWMVQLGQDLGLVAQARYFSLPHSRAQPLERHRLGERTGPAGPPHHTGRA